MEGAHEYSASERLGGAHMITSLTDRDAAGAYDAAGNRQPADNHSYNTYNAANMLTDSNGSTYTNDWNGNTLAGGGRSNTWDSQNRLAETIFGSTTTSFTYGPDGLRRTATAGGTTTQYILDGSNVVQERVGNAYATYLWGPRGPEARIDPSGNALWYLYDGHGNVLGEVNDDGVINPDANGVPTATRDFDPWGYVRNYQQVADNGNPLKYCGSLGHPSENSTGLIYMRARYYDPVLGRFISEDPARDGANWYAYAGNNPIMGSDPQGLLTEGEQAAAGYIEGVLMRGGGGAAARALLGRVGEVAEAISMRMAAYDMMFQEAFQKAYRGGAGQYTWKYVGYVGGKTRELLIRWDFRGGHVNIEGWEVLKRELGGHAVDFQSFLNNLGL